MDDKPILMDNFLKIKRDNNSPITIKGTDQVVFIINGCNWRVLSPGPLALWHLVER